MMEVRGWDIKTKQYFLLTMTPLILYPTRLTSGPVMIIQIILLLHTLSLFVIDNIQRNN